jgi:murein DD-endopeptidase MepM/ murein hydrolase activator NlpD
MFVSLLFAAQLAYVRPLTETLQYPLSDRAPVSSPFSPNRCLTGICRPHRGIDLVAPLGTIVLAAHAGKVVKAGWYGGYGKCIMIEGFARRTLYGHLSEIDVQAGQQVEAGSTIGRVGSTGRSTGPHLHFEVHQRTVMGWSAINPQPLLK